MEMKLKIFEKGDWHIIATGAKLTFKNITTKPIYVVFNDGTKPNADALGWTYGSEEGERFVDVSSLGEGVTTAWAKIDKSTHARVLVDYNLADPVEEEDEEDIIEE